MIDNLLSIKFNIYLINFSMWVEVKKITLKKLLRITIDKAVLMTRSCGNKWDENAE